MSFIRDLYFEGLCHNYSKLEIVPLRQLCTLVSSIDYKASLRMQLLEDNKPLGVIEQDPVNIYNQFYLSKCTCYPRQGPWGYVEWGKASFLLIWIF